VYTLTSQAQSDYSVDGNRENVTIIECVCANRTALLPLYIFKGQRLQQTWVADDPLRAFKAASPNGWTSNELGVGWLCNVFDPQTCHFFPNHWLLIYDGHASHLSLEFVEYTWQHNIVLICFPAHVTAIIQPLDVVLFSPLSTQWSQVLKANLIGGLTMRKQELCRYVFFTHCST
jgi:hypothetical protein